MGITLMQITSTQRVTVRYFFLLQQLRKPCSTNNLSNERANISHGNRGKHVSRFCVTIDYNSIYHTFAVLDPVAVDSSKRSARYSSSASATQTTCIFINFREERLFFGAKMGTMVRPH